MTLQDLSNGPSWVMWVVFGIFLILTIILLTGHGANLVAGYNTADAEEKSKYDSKKLSRVVGVGFLVITILILIATLLESILPSWIAYIFLAVIFIDCVTMMILAGTVCKK